MSKFNLEIINFFIWIFTLIFAILPFTSTILYEFFGLLTAAFDLFIFPGVFFYFKYKDYNH